MTPGKARLWTGICCVGTLVCAASALLAADWPRSVLPGPDGGPMTDYCVILSFLATTAAVLLPFDFIGGMLIPAAREKQPRKFVSWLKQWARSVAVQLVFYSVTLFIYLQIAREVGAMWLIAMFATVQVGLLAGQELIWRIMTAHRPTASRRTQTQFVRHSDSRFAGGITGLPGLESILMPEDWKNRLPPAGLRILVKRRQAALQTGGRLRGILAAMVWNISAFTAAILLSGAVVASVADLITVFLWFLLLSFTGLLVLPMLNRQGVFALDRYLTSRVSPEQFRETISAVDEIAEQDPARSASAESVFQPVPCPERRTRSLSSEAPTVVLAWNVARTALFLTWAFGGPLARAVHCNVGRPELWAILPAD